MARAKKLHVTDRQEQARTTWTRFHLSRQQRWIQWPAKYPDLDLGPLADVPDRLTVRLGRMVQDPESAVLIIRTCSFLLMPAVWLTCPNYVA